MAWPVGTIIVKTRSLRVFGTSKGFWDPRSAAAMVRPRAICSHRGPRREIEGLSLSLHHHRQACILNRTMAPGPRAQS